MTMGDWNETIRKLTGDYEDERAPYIATNTGLEEHLLAHDPRLKAACDAVGAKAGHGPCCMPLDILKIIKAVDEIDKAQARDGEWWCPSCKRVCDPTEVTFSEHHEACGTRVE